MKISKILHVLSVLAGGLGVITFIGTIVSGGDNFVFGITKFDALFCTAILFLIAIWGQLGAIHHMMLEKTGERV